MATKSKKALNLLAYFCALLVVFELPYVLVGYEVDVYDIIADFSSIAGIQAVTVMFVKGVFPFSENA